MKIWKWLKLLNSVPFIKKHLYIMFIFEFDHLDWLSQFYSEWRQTSKLVNFQDFCYSPRMRFRWIIWKLLKLLNSVPFIKNPLVNQVCIWIWSFWLTNTVLQWMKKNLKNIKFSRFLLRKGGAILIKIWKWLKLLNYVPFTKKTLVNQLYIRIRSFWLTFTFSPWMKKNSKNNQFSRILLRSEYTIQVKIWKWLKLLYSIPFIKKRLLNHVYIRIWSFWLTFTVSQRMKPNIKISQFSRFLLRSECEIQVNIW